MSFGEYIDTMKELGWKEEDLQDDYVLYQTSEKNGITLPWRLFLKPCTKKDSEEK